MLKSNIDVFCDVISLLALVSLFHRIEYPKRCLLKIIENFLCLSLCDMTVPSKSNVPSLVTLTFDL